MKKFRYKTLDELFKINDEDFKTPAHDDLWLKCQDTETLSKIIKAAGAQIWTSRNCAHCSKCSWSWDKYECSCTDTYQQNKIKADVEAFTQTTSKMTALPDYILKGNIRTETPVVANNGFVVGFVDIFVDLSKARFSSPSSILERYVKPDMFLIEVKPKIKSIGETIRQISLYKHYLRNSVPIVVTTSDTIIPSAPFSSQGIFLYYFGNGM